jgi:hypothetical protein
MTSILKREGLIRLSRPSRFVLTVLSAAGVVIRETIFQIVRVLRKNLPLPVTPLIPPLAAAPPVTGVRRGADCRVTARARFPGRKGSAPAACLRLPVHAPLHSRRGKRGCVEEARACKRSSRRPPTDSAADVRGRANAMDAACCDPDAPRSTGNTSLPATRLERSAKRGRGRNPLATFASSPERHRAGRTSFPARHAERRSARRYRGERPTSRRCGSPGRRRCTARAAGKPAERARRLAKKIAKQNAARIPRRRSRHE